MNAVLIELPVPIFTDRLLIRPLISGDGAMICKGTLESLNELRAWMPWAQGEPDPVAAEVRARQCHARWILREDLALVILDKTTNEFIGCCGFHRVDWQVPCFEMGYWIHSKKANQGYASESCRGLASYAFSVLKARRLEIRCDEDNKASARVAEKSGFALEACLHSDAPKCEDAKILRNTLVFARFDTDDIKEAATW